MTVEMDDVERAVLVDDAAKRLERRRPHEGQLDGVRMREGGGDCGTERRLPGHVIAAARARRDDHDPQRGTVPCRGARCPVAGWRTRGVPGGSGHARP